MGLGIGDWGKGEYKEGRATEVNDILNYAFTELGKAGNTGTYTAWYGKTDNSDVVYARQVFKFVNSKDLNEAYIQIHNTNPAEIVTTSS